AAAIRNKMEDLRKIAMKMGEQAYGDAGPGVTPGPNVGPGYGPDPGAVGEQPGDDPDVVEGEYREVT
ncbi:MAG: hypothetical protein MUQ30_09685, partial [Anaerolineae bacterium]|nr:hypothetical protein [Anaerolineae bacterium]